VVPGDAHDRIDASRTDESVRLYDGDRWQGVDRSSVPPTHAGMRSRSPTLTR